MTSENGITSNGGAAGPGRNGCQFKLAPPRNFVYPAILLLLAEEPRHGYRLVDALLRFGLGPFDRPSVYRTLSDLENMGLLDSWTATPTAGSARQVYALTTEGERVLAAWMSIVADEHAALGNVLSRYTTVCHSRNGFHGQSAH